jgi:antirestriction protein ArdC
MGVAKMHLAVVAVLNHYTSRSRSPAREIKMSNVYEIITERIIEKLKAGTAPWQRPWNAEAGSQSQKAVDFIINKREVKVD